MAYCTTTDVKLYGGWVDSDTGDDTVLGVIIPYAQQMIDSYTGRTFEVDNSSSDKEVVRYFDAEADVYEHITLTFDKDLYAMGHVFLDGSAISSDSYVMEPRNSTPYWGITLYESSSDTFDYGTDSANAISISGHWAYSSDAPADIELACITLVNWLLKQRNSDLALTAPIIDASAGVTILPVTVPNLVRQILNSYKRIGFEVV